MEKAEAAMKGKFRSTLKRLATSGKHHRYLHAALIAKGSQVFGAGVNTDGHHAEVNAIVRAGKNCKGSTLYTLMLRRSDHSLGNGAPCEICMEAISQAKLKRVIVYV